jgi:hypothetical protein
MQRLMKELGALRSGRELIAFVAAQDWTVVDAETRFIALHEINTAICRVRERASLEPIADALPGEQPTVFQLIRPLLSFPS